MRSEAPARLAELVARYGLTDAQQGQLARLLELIAGDGLAPTAVRAPEVAVERHVADSLAGLEIPQLAEARAIADLGSGAGLPGLVLAAALPGASVALVESQARKCAFIQGAAEAMGLKNAEVVCARAEEWSDGLGGRDVVVARALAAQPVVLEYAAPLLRVGGSVVDWRGRRNPAEEVRAAHAASELGLERERVHRVAPAPGADEHHLHVFRKTHPTPSRFPRRPGVATRRPLGR
jgi:16S rRNA (guanine527-N7)-methyltransferase